ncbi:MAG: 2Fe-2S iron-sulfur cluster-binding protein [Rhizomicrobium sp.]
MAKITYIEFNGREHVVDIKPGLSVMEGAKTNNIPGIDADCGGGCSCGTCHVYVDTAWLARVGGRTPIEDATIEFADNVKDNSRLSCQIKITDALDGLIVRMPESQR